MELFDHLTTDLLYTMLDHVHLPGDHNSHQLPLLNNILSLSQLLILKSSDTSKTFHRVEYLHFSNFVQLTSSVIQVS